MNEGEIVTTKNKGSVTPMDRDNATPAKLVARASAPLAIFKRAAQLPEVPRVFLPVLYDVREPDARELAALIGDWEVLPAGIDALEEEVEEALSIKPDRASIRVMAATMIESHLPSAAAVRSSSPEFSIEELVNIAIDHEFSHIICSRARRIALERTRFAIGQSDFLQACEAAKQELGDTLANIKLRRKVAAIIAAPPPAPPAVDQQRRLALLRRA